MHSSTENHQIMKDNRPKERKDRSNHVGIFLKCNSNLFLQKF